MIILSIETSCDDTSVAVLKITPRRDSRQIPKFKILSNIISSQVKIHAKWGGVFPSLAKREHQKNLPIVYREALRQAKNPEINLVAVTKGPGLEPCLWVGVNFAKDVAKRLKIPLVAVNHIEAHILANCISNSKFSANIFPSVALVVSGGHTQIILITLPRNSSPQGPTGAENTGAISNWVKGFQYQILGETRDDAAGECFDKVARILGLGYPGGPIISKLASMKTPRISLPIRLPRPMMSQKNYDFSFSGLKTAVLYDFKSRPKEISKSPSYIQRMCLEAQQAIIDVLISKTIRAVKDFKARSLILGGGVISNGELKKQFKAKIKKEGLGINLLFPEPVFCTDNAAMVAIAGYYNWMSGKIPQKEVEAEANLRLE